MPLLGSLLGLSLGLLAGTSAQQVSSATDPAVLHVRFLDSDGVPVTDLRPEEIRLTDTGVAQQILAVAGPEEPFSVGLLLDVSPSVEGYVPVIREETRRFFGSLPDDSPMLILTFDDEVYIDADWTTDRKKIDEAIYEFGLHKPGSSSIIYEALSLTLELKYAETGPRTALILFSDGWETGSDEVSDKDSIQQLKESGVLGYVLQYDSRQHYRRIYYASVPYYDPTRGPLPRPTVGGTSIGGIHVGSGSEIDQAEYKVQYGHERATKYLMQTAAAGRTHLQTLQLSGANLGAIYQRILQDLSQLYTVTFRPEQQHPPTHLRAITVTTTRAGVTARPVTAGYWP